MHKINESHQHFLCFVKPCRIFVFCMLLFFLFLVQNKCWKSLQNSIVGCVYSSRIRFYVFLCNRPSCIIQKMMKFVTTKKQIFAPKIGGGGESWTRNCKKTCVYKGRGCRIQTQVQSLKTSFLRFLPLNFYFQLFEKNEILFDKNAVCVRIW